MRVRVVVLVTVLCGVFGRPASGQVDRATLSGSITDTSGAVIAGAKVEVVSQETGLRRELLSSETGGYTFSQLPIGVYTVTASQKGFRTVIVRDLRLGVGDNRALNIEMEVSSVETTVTVEDTLTPLESTSPVIGTVIGSQHVREIPLNGRH